MVDSYVHSKLTVFQRQILKTSVLLGDIFAYFRANTVSSRKYAPSSKCLSPPSSCIGIPPPPNIECLVHMLLLSIVFVNMYTQNYYSLICSLVTDKVFVAHPEIMWSRPLPPLTMQVALIPLGLVTAQAPLISCTTCKVKLLFFQKGVICTRQIEYLSKRPFLTFASK